MDENKKKGCCCDHDEHAAEDCCCDYEDDEIVTLVSEDGEEQEFFTLATFDLDGKWYIVLEPAQPIEGFQEGDVIIFRLEEEYLKLVRKTMPKTKHFSTLLRAFLVGGTICSIGQGINDIYT
ncbi:MAG: DUF1292 domain-containing protein, partial [Clostridiales bacterium]|nr:DUF1292 domain-containing protein [Clostridiales bacterium]